MTPLSLLRTLTTSPMAPSCSAAPSVMIGKSAFGVDELHFGAVGDELAVGDAPAAGMALARQQRQPRHLADDDVRGLDERAAAVAASTFRDVRQHLVADHVAGIDDRSSASGRLGSSPRGDAGTATTERKRDARRRHAVARGDRPERVMPSHRQPRMLEIVPDIWSAAWMTLEFIS